ncbi:RNA-binding protein 33 isoform X2 [Siphateles boraxobius]|uniref:RNA-binding protein 33 isoform X2 n=1 Tax=Siphateles boraxobius TaxID=180520 RepID=UPI004062B97D
MATNVGDDDFDEYDKPGAERSRRRRGEDDDDLESDLEEGDLLEEDWLSSKKNPSELSDEELNDDLLQSDEEDQNTSGQGEAVSLNATLGLGTSGHLQDEDIGCTENAYEETEGCRAGFSQGGQYEADEYQAEDEGLEYIGGQNCDEYPDEVLDLQIDEPLDDDFQVDEYPTEYSEEQTDRQEVAEEEEHEEETEEQDSSQITDLEEVENENDPEAEPEQDADVKEESDEEEEDVEESRRLRFKTERKDETVVRLSDAASKRRNIPETLELSEEAKANLQEFEEKERQRKQGRFGGRGRGWPRPDGMRGGMAGRGGIRGRGGAGGRGVGGRGNFPLFGMGGFRGDGVGGQGRINEQRPPLMQVNLGMQQLRMTPPLQHHHHQSRPPGARGAGGPGLFPDPGTPIPQQPLQLLMPHLAHRSPGPRTQHDTHGLRLLNSPPRHSHAHPNQHQQHQQHHPKNIHINPHFRGPSSSPVQVPSMPPVQNQPRPNITPQRLPVPPDFQQHLQGNFGPPQRPLPSQEQWRGPPPHHQDQEHFFSAEPRFSGQHMFDQPGPAPLMNNSVLPISGQGPPSFPPQGGLGGPGFGPLGLGQNQGPQGEGAFQREPLRPGLAPHHAGPPGPHGPRAFVGHRQPFSPQQQGPPFSPQHMLFGMQVRQRGLLQQPLHHDPSLSHQPLQQHQQHRQDLPPQGLPHSQHPPQHQQHHQHHPRDHHPMVHLSQPHFRQSIQSSHRQMQSRPQGNQQRNNHARPRMTPPPPLQQIPPQRNSNLRELPIASSNNNNRPSVPSGQAKPVTQNVRQGQAARSGPAGSGGPVAQGQGSARAPQQPSVSGMKTVCPAAQSSTTPEDPDEDEETRQYRLKIEEQKRLREEILKRKEQRRQMQAGERKRQLMERISGQNPNQTPQTQNPTPTPAAQPPQPVPSLISNGSPQNPSSGLSSPRPIVKARLQNTKPQAQASGWSAPQKQQNPGPDANQQGQWQAQQKRTTTPQNTQRPGAVQTSPLEGHGLGQPQLGGKRTVMQRTNSIESPQVPQKVRLVKLLGEADAGPNTGPPQQQQQPIGRPAQQQRLGPIRKVTMATGGVQSQQQAGRGVANQTNRLVVRGRGRGRGGGRMMMQQSPRAEDCQPSTVCIEGLSTTTTNKQLMNLLNSIGPVEMFTMLPEQRKAIAKFVNPEHAVSFQHSFHRHMIDLSHIDVSVIDG